MTKEQMLSPEYGVQFRLFAAGDEKALQRLYQEWYPSLLSYAARFIGCPFEGATLVQEAVLKAWQSRENMESLYHVYSFIRLTIRWEAHHYLRSPCHRFRTGNLLPLDEVEYREALLAEAWNFLSREEEMRAETERHETGLQRLVGELPKQKQTILHLWSREGKSIAGIARRFCRSRLFIIGELKASFIYLRKALDGGQTLPKHSLLWSECFHGLPPQSREILRLRIERNWNFVELAQHFNIPIVELVYRFLAAREIIESGGVEGKSEKKRGPKNAVPAGELV